MITALLLGAVVTGTVTDALTDPWLQRVGFAPRDLWELDLARLFTSVLVTRGPRILLGALIMTALSVALVERKAGWRTGLTVFWGLHLLTVVLMALILSFLGNGLQSSVAETLLTTRDVGPSAGYLGSLGFGLGCISGRLRTVAVAGVLVWLGLDAAGVLGRWSELPQELSADMAHLLAFCLGLLIAGARAS